MKALLLLLLAGALGHQTSDLGDFGTMSNRGVDLQTDSFILGASGNAMGEEIMNTTDVHVRSTKPTAMIEMPLEEPMVREEMAEVAEKKVRKGRSFSIARQLSQSPTAILEAPMGELDDSEVPPSLFARESLLEGEGEPPASEMAFQEKKARLQREAILPTTVPLPSHVNGFRPILFIFISGGLFGMSVMFIMLSQFGMGFCYCCQDGRKKAVDGTKHFKEVTEEAQFMREKEFQVARDWLRNNATTFMDNAPTVVENNNQAALVTDSEAENGSEIDFTTNYETLGEAALRKGCVVKVPPPLPPIAVEDFMPQKFAGRVSDSESDDNGPAENLEDALDGPPFLASPLIQE